MSFLVFDDGNFRPRTEERFSTWALDSLFKMAKRVEGSPPSATGKTFSITNYEQIK